MRKTKTKKQTEKLTKATKIGLIAVALIVLSAISAWAFTTFRTYPLGSDGRVVYLGKVHSTGDGVVAPSYEKYYYGTDMTPEELAGYFGGKNGDSIDISNEYVSYDLNLTYNNKKVPILFYKDKNSTYYSPEGWARNTSKRYFFVVIDDYYQILKNSLEK